MSELIGLFNLLAPFFGLIGLGFFCGRVVRQPEAGLAWMQFFLIYIALPCLFFRLIADKPLDQLANWPFIAATTVSTFLAFLLAFGTGFRHTPDLPQSVMQGVAGSYSNVGYMGPPLVLGALGAGASAPVVLIFVFDNLLLFSLVPLLMSVAGVEKLSLAATARKILWRILTHPFNVATMLGISASYFHLSLPQAADQMVTWLSGAAAPCALFILGVTVAMRPLWRIPEGVPALVVIKLIVHPVLIWLVLSAIGDFGPVWTYAAITMAALPPALNIFVVATQYNVGVERASACVLIGTLASMVTLAGLLFVIQIGVLPYDLFP
ncbi:AEC family transporter [Microvirga brassicacearum]|uniref:AEC family transporter n=1 Tax=Microvirga brassicacearum TaxID=2580413 RepID=A0A5N3P8V0_9HYPH|nr:AEC family transporter [Microvirga brassicacearum]KAB0266162.1 AEC family transporter [Microvirga brassicacearum]